MSKRASHHTSLLKSFELWSRFATDNATMLWSASEVIGRRTARMAAHGIAPDAHERNEMHRMVSEKQSALVEGSLAAWQEWLRVSQASWLDLVRLSMHGGLSLTPFASASAPGDRRRAPRWTAPLDTQLRIAEAAIRPVRARVAANQKRLSA